MNRDRSELPQLSQISANFGAKKGLPLENDFGAVNQTRIELRKRGHDRDRRTSSENPREHVSPLRRLIDTLGPSTIAEVKNKNTLLWSAPAGRWFRQMASRSRAPATLCLTLFWAVIQPPPLNPLRPLVLFVLSNLCP